MGNISYYTEKGLKELRDKLAQLKDVERPRASQAIAEARDKGDLSENAEYDAERSRVVGNVGVALPPTAEGVMMQAASGNGYIGYFDGGAFGIPHSSKNKEATMLWLQYLGQNEVQADWAIAGGRITHKATYSDPKVVAVDAKADAYFTLMRDTGYLFAGAPPYPFHGAGRAAIDPFIFKALAGELTPEEALDQAAAAVDELMKELGYAK